MKTLSRRSAIAATAAVSVSALAELKPSTVRAMDMLAMDAGTDKTLAPGVVMRVYGESPAIIQGFKTVKLLDFIMQPGSKTPNPGDPMPNAMVCHTLEGELRVVQNGKEFMAPKNHVWTCDKGTTEQAFNDGKVEAIMRMTFLLPA